MTSHPFAFPLAHRARWTTRAWSALAGAALLGLLGGGAPARAAGEPAPAKAVGSQAAPGGAKVTAGRPKDGDRFRDCESDVCPWMVVVPAGSFMMGATAREEGYRQDESPVHRVKLRRFAIGATEVSFEQYDACAEAKACEWLDDSRWGRGKRPVINVQFEHATAYVKWLSAKTGKRYRLPSESEWEYAARAGTTTVFAYGDRLDPSNTNYAANFTYNGSVKGKGRDQTLPVGSLKPNAWGLHDMHGNVLEWVQDCFHDDYKGAPADGRPWTKNCSEDRHVLRGGSWYDNPVYTRVAFRGGLWAGNATATGLRVVRDVD